MIKAEFIDENMTNVSISGNGIHIANELEAIIGSCGKNPALLKLLEIAIDRVMKDTKNEKK